MEFIKADKLIPTFDKSEDALVLNPLTIPPKNDPMPLPIFSRITIPVSSHS